MTRLIVLGAALAAMALVGLWLAWRPEDHLRASRDRARTGRPLPLEALSRRAVPWLETPRGYRAIGVAIVVVAVLFFAYLLVRSSQGTL